MFPGDEENSNVQMGAHARRLRTFTTLAGRPTVIALCHPAKNASEPDHLNPRGGGAYLAEVDGNLSVWNYGDRLADLHWCGKFRGPNFEKITFKHETVNTMALVDAKGQLIPTVVSRAVTGEETQEAEHVAISQEDYILTAMLNRPHGTLEEWAADCGWHFQDGGANKSMAKRVIDRLQKAKLVTKEGRDFVLTRNGKEAAKRASERSQK